MITRAWKTGAAWRVDGKVFLDGGWRNAGFIVSASDIEHMTREEFREWAIKRLPMFPEGKHWDV